MTVDVERIWKQVRRKQNVVGYSGTLKPKISNGKEQRVRSARIYVREKIEDPLRLTKLERSGNLIPKEIDGVPTDIIQVGRMRAMADQRAHWRPAPAGVSAIAEGGSACSLGWFARDLTDDEIVVIANNHCTSLEDTLKPGALYLQTSPYDKAHGKVEKLGVLKRAVPLKFDSYTCPVRDTLARTLNPLYWIRGAGMNRVDLGIVSVEDCDIKREVLDLGPIMGTREGELGEKAMKMGRTTGITRNGILIDNDYFGNIQYSRGILQFGPCGLIEGTGFCAGGDSSSCILWESDHKMPGLLFAGSDTHTIFCHYRFIEEEGQLKIVW